MKYHIDDGPIQPGDKMINYSARVVRNRSVFVVMSTKVLNFAHKGFPVVILRPGAFYGPWGRYAFNRLFFD